MEFQKIRTNISEMLAESTAGLPRIFKSKKIFWFAFLILGNIASFHYIIKAINNYLEYMMLFLKELPSVSENIQKNFSINT